MLVLGGSVLGSGIQELLKYPEITLIESDVTFGPRTKMICDAHALPFLDNSLDAVISQAVLEHVADSNQCVSEILRVLKPEGAVYAETPFMQPVHGRPYDFSRFTDLGHRRLFRKFQEIDTGIVAGPGMSLALSYQNFLASFVSHKKLKNLLMAFGSITSF